MGKVRYTRVYLPKSWFVKQWILVFLSCGLWYPFYRWQLHKYRRPTTESYYE